MGQSSSAVVKGDYIASVLHRGEEQTEFKDRVFSVALSKDGSTLVSAGTDSVVRWSVSTAKRLSSFTTKRGPFYCVAVSNDASLICAGVHGVPDVLLWRPDKDLLTALKGHQDKVYCVAFTPDGGQILSGSADSTIKLWNAESGELEGTMEGHESDVLCLAVAKDSSVCVSGSADRRVKLWDLKGRAHGCTLVGHTDEVRCVDLSPDGLNIVSGGSDHTIKLWHRRTGQLKGELNAEQGEVCCVDFSHDGQLLISGGSDGSIKVWNFCKGTLLATYHGHSDQVSAVAACPFNYSLVRLVSSSWDETIKFWSLPAPDGGGPSMGTPPVEKVRSKPDNPTGTAIPASASEASGPHTCTPTPPPPAANSAAGSKPQPVKSGAGEATPPLGPGKPPIKPSASVALGKG